MRKAIYIHGLGGSGNGSSATNVRNFLKGRYELSANTYDLLQPEEAFAQIKNDVEGFDLIIASSLGAFYASALDKKIPTILLNPCLEPKSAIPPLLYPEQKAMFNQEKCFKEWDKISLLREKLSEESRVETVSGDEDFRTVKVGIFADNDEYFSFKEKFISLFGTENEEEMSRNRDTFGGNKNCFGIHGTHEIAKHPEMLKDALEKAFTYINACQ